MRSPPNSSSVDTGGHASPLWNLALTHAAVTHTVAPGGTVGGNSTVIEVRLVAPSAFHAVSSAGGASPTNE